MGFTVLPTNIGGVSLNSLASPLASLIGGTPSAQIMNFPSDLGSNPAMCHAVTFQAYDYKTGLGNSINSLLSGASLQNFITSSTGALTATGTAIAGAANQVASGNFSGALGTVGNLLNGAANSGVGQLAINSITASAYTPLTKGTPLATISLFMPETMNINYSAEWGEVSLTKELGLAGKLGNAYADMKAGQGLQDVATPYATFYGSQAAGNLLGASGAAGLVSQSLGIAMENPQTQLLYKGTDLRKFQLVFILTPKTAAEAVTVKNVCDSFAYFSLPGLSGAQGGSAGQFFTPPQVFSVQFQFLGGSNIGSQISNAISSALNTSGLNVLTNANGGSTPISSGTPSKTFTVNDCVLENVNIDYAPNGWATYNDGYPVQTILSLDFKETTVYTKNQMAQTAVAQNYNKQQQINQFGSAGAQALQDASTPMAGGNGTWSI
jgi:hypothetical protein